MIDQKMFISLAKLYICLSLLTLYDVDIYMSYGFI